MESSPPPPPPLVCIDVSGSTGGCYEYWKRTIEIVKAAMDDYGGKSFPLYLWNDRVDAMDADLFLAKVTVRLDCLSDGGTSTAALCSALLRIPQISPQKRRLVLVTDGEVPWEEARLVDEIIRRAMTVPWDDVDAYIINERSRSEVDLSVLMPFIQGHPYHATLVGRGARVDVRSTTLRSASETTAVIHGINTIAEFEAAYEELMARIVVDTAFSHDPQVRTALLELQKRLINEMATATATLSSSSEGDVTINCDSVLAAGEAWYARQHVQSGGPTFITKIQRILGLFTASTNAASNLSRQRFMQTESDASAVASQMPQMEVRDEVDVAFEDPITYDPQVPALTFKNEGPHVLSAANGFQEAFVDHIKRNPFVALGSKAFRQALLDKFDCVLGGATLKALHTRAIGDNDGFYSDSNSDSYEDYAVDNTNSISISIISPMTRAHLIPHVMSLVSDELDEDNDAMFADRMRASLMAQVLFGGDKLYGSAGAWTVVFWHVLKDAAIERTHTDVSARAVERGLDGLVERVIRSTKARLSLSGAGLHPTTYVPLGAAMLYCVKSMYMTPPDRNRMPEMLGAFEAFEDALALVGVDVSTDRPRVDTLRWAARLISDCIKEGAGRDNECLRRACVDVCKPYVRTVDCGGRGSSGSDVVLLDAERTERTNGEDNDEDEKEKRTRFKLLANPVFNPASYTIGKLSLPCGSPPALQNLRIGQHYSKEENDETHEIIKVAVHPKTLRPYLMVPGGPDGQLRLWEEAAAEAAGPVSKQISMHKLILEYFVSHGEFPQPGDESALYALIAYASRANKCKKTAAMAAATVPVLPVNIVNNTRQVIEEVAEAVAERRRIYGDEACTADRIRADILDGERRTERERMEVQHTRMI